MLPTAGTTPGAGRLIAPVRDAADEALLPGAGCVSKVRSEGCLDMVSTSFLSRDPDGLSMFGCGACVPWDRADAVCVTRLL